MALAVVLQILGCCTEEEVRTRTYLSSCLTCNRSSKSRAASFFISEALVANRLIVLEPNVGMARNLVVAGKFINSR